MMMRTDLNLHTAVRGVLRDVLGSAATGVVVHAEDGIVRLSGAVQTADEKRAAEHAVQLVPGVHAVVEAIKVVNNAGPTVTDQALAQNALRALATGAHPIGRDVTIKVENGWLTLGGTVSSAVEYAAVERALECLDGARGIKSEVRVTNTTTDGAACRVAPSAM